MKAKKKLSDHTTFFLHKNINKIMIVTKNQINSNAQYRVKNVFFLHLQDSPGQYKCHMTPAKGPIHLFRIPHTHTHTGQTRDHLIQSHLPPVHQPQISWEIVRAREIKSPLGPVKIITRLSAKIMAWLKSVTDSPICTFFLIRWLRGQSGDWAFELGGGKVAVWDLVLL